MLYDSRSQAVLQHDTGVQRRYVVHLRGSVEPRQSIRFDMRSAVNGDGRYHCKWYSTAHVGT